MPPRIASSASHDSVPHRTASGSVPARSSTSGPASACSSARSTATPSRSSQSGISTPDPLARPSSPSARRSNRSPAPTGAPVGAGERFERRAEGLLGRASGSGVEIPDWLERLGVAVERALEQAEAGPDVELRAGTLPDAVRWGTLSWEALEAILGGT